MGRKRNAARAERIREQVDISQVLISYGYHVHGGAEHQFSCDLHGDGLDSKPSARVYPASSSWYCFACDRTRDAIQTVIEKEGVGFIDAMKVLEDRYNLPSMPWMDEDEPDKDETNPFDETYRRARSYEEERGAVERHLCSLTGMPSDRWPRAKPGTRRSESSAAEWSNTDLPMELLLGFWEAFDLIEYRVRKGWEESKGAAAMVSLMKKVRERSIAHLKATYAQ